MGEIIPVATMFSLILPVLANYTIGGRALGVLAIPLIADAAAVAIFAPKSAAGFAANTLRGGFRTME